MKTLEKIIINSLLLGALAFSLSGNLHAQDSQINKKQKKIYTFNSFGADILYEPKICKVSNIPEYVRDVPCHPKDSPTSKKMGLIRDSTLKYPSFFFANFTPSTGIGFRRGVYDFKIGGSIDCMLMPLFSNSIVERNYSEPGTEDPGTPVRGIGTALTYYGIMPPTLFAGALESLIPGLFFKISKKINFQTSQKENRAFLEYSINFLDVYISNGWDRYDELERKEKYKLLDLTRHIIKLGFERIEEAYEGGNSTGFYIGIVIPSAKPSLLGRQTTLKIQDHLIVGYCFKGLSKEF